MALHRCARLRDGAGLNRLQDLLVFSLKRFKLDTTRGEGRWAVPDRPARYDETAKILQESRELRVSGRGGDRAMEREVFVDRTLAAVDGGLDGIESVGNLLELCR